MPSITRKQVEAANAKLHNGFRLDIQHYVIHGEKQAVLQIPVDGAADITHSTEFITGALTWMPEREEKQNTCGQTFTVATGKQVPTLHIQHWRSRPGSNVATSQGLGQYVSVGKAQDRRNFSVLQKLSEKIDTAVILLCYDPKETQNPFLI